MERKKPILVITICLLSLVALMAATVGCEGTAETTEATTAQTTTETETATETVEPVTLKVAPGGIMIPEAIFGAIPWWASERLAGIS